MQFGRALENNRDPEIVELKIPEYIKKRDGSLPSKWHFVSQWCILEENQSQMSHIVMTSETRIFDFYEKRQTAKQALFLV